MTDNAPSDDVAKRIAAIKAKMGGAAPAPGAPQNEPAAAAAAAKPAAGAAAAAAAKPAPSKAGAKAIFPVTPIDRTSFGDDRLYAPATLNKWFTVGGLMLLVTVVWMLEHDWVRDWKGF